MSNQITLQSNLSIDKIYSNAQVAIILITEDKLENLLTKHIAACSQKDKWHTPFGVLVTIILAFITTEFKDALHMSKSTWQAIFVISMFLCAGWLARNLLEIWKNKNTNINQLMREIKNSSDEIKENEKTINTPPPSAAAGH